MNTIPKIMFFHIVSRHIRRNFFLCGLCLFGFHFFAKIKTTRIILAFANINPGRQATLWIHLKLCGSSHQSGADLFA